MRVVVSFDEGTDPVTVVHIEAQLRAFAQHLEANYLPWGVRAKFEDDAEE